MAFNPSLFTSRAFTAANVPKPKAAYANGANNNNNRKKLSFIHPQVLRLADGGKQSVAPLATVHYIVTLNPRETVSEETSYVKDIAFIMRRPMI